MATEEKTVGYFEETTDIGCGILAKRHLRWSDINSLARAMANASLVADEQRGTMVLGALTPFAETFLFLVYCTDCNTKQFEYPEPEDKTEDYIGGEINADALMDWAMENSIDKEYFGEWCESWGVACKIADNLARVVYEQYRQEMDFGHKLTMAFGDVLDGTSEDIIKNANGLGEMLIDLIGKTKEAAKPQGDIVSLAKKRK